METKHYALLKMITDIWIYSKHSMKEESDTVILQQMIDSFLQLLLEEFGPLKLPNLDTLRLWPRIIRYLGIPK